MSDGEEHNSYEGMEGEEQAVEEEEVDPVEAAKEKKAVRGA
jgi:hypothetical protein